MIVRLIILVLVLVTGCTATGTSTSDQSRPRTDDRATHRATHRPESTSPAESSTARQRPAPDDSARPQETVPIPPGENGQPPSVRREVTGWWSWALIDRRTGEVRGSANRTNQTTSTESMVKAWLVADQLATIERRGRTPTTAELFTMSSAIRVSDDAAADQLYWTLGADATLRRMVDTCDLTDTRLVPGNWALTQITARDAATLGACLADGSAAGPTWTPWLLSHMRTVDASNAFGIREAFPPSVAAQIAVKNGWTPRNGQWHIACLGVTDAWSLAVLVRYPDGLGLSYGAGVCRDVARQLFR